VGQDRLLGLTALAVQDPDLIQGLQLLQHRALLLCAAQLPLQLL
jgi:hypothetical protein